MTLLECWIILLSILLFIKIFGKKSVDFRQILDLLFKAYFEYLFSNNTFQTARLYLLELLIILDCMLSYSSISFPLFGINIYVNLTHEFWEKDLCLNFVYYGYKVMGDFGKSIYV